MTLRKGESPGFYGTPSTSTLRFVRTSCPTKVLWSFKATLHGVEANAAPFLVREAKSDRLRGLRTRICHRQRYSPRRPEHNQQVLQAPAQASTVARNKVARSQAHLRDPAPSSRHSSHLRPEVFGTRFRAANPRLLLPLDAEHGPQHRRRDRRSFGLTYLVHTRPYRRASADTL